MLLPIFVNAKCEMRNANCEQDSVMLTCELDNKGDGLKACYNKAENSMYFVIDENGLKPVYTPLHGNN